MFLKKSKVEWIIVGLGNPGREYEKTRHNVGFRTVDLLAKQAGVKIDRAKFRSLSAVCTLAGKRVLLLKPETFMNCSGEAVQLAAMFYQVRTISPFRLAASASGPRAPQAGTTA